MAVGFLLSELAVAERVLCLFGSCGWAAGVHALGARLGPPIVFFLWGPKMDQLSIEFSEVAHLRGS